MQTNTQLFFSFIFSLICLIIYLLGSTTTLIISRQILNFSFFILKIYMSIELQPTQTFNHKIQHANLSPIAFTNLNRLLKNSSQLQFRTIQSISKTSIFYISPTSKFSLFYNLFYLLVFYMLQVHISLTITFGLHFLSSDISNDIFSAYYWTMVVYFICDLFITFGKGYYHKQKGKIIDDQGKIVRRYLKFQFWIDFMCIWFLIIPYASQTKGTQYLMCLPIILMWIKKFNTQQQIIQTIQYKKSLRTIFILTILFCDILMVGHYGACLFLKIDFILQSENYYSDPKYYWYNQNDPYHFTTYDKHWYYLYIYAQSFSTGTLVTIAPGPFSKNLISVLFSISLTIFFIVLTSYVAEILIQIIETDSKKRIVYQQNIELFDKFMRWKKVPLKIQTQVNNNFEMVWDFESRNELDDQQKMLFLLPQSLRQSLILQLSFVKKIQIFQQFHNSNIFLYQLSKKISKRIISSESQLFKQIQKKHQLTEDYTYFSCNNIIFLLSGMIQFSLRFKKCIHIKEQIISLSNNNKFIGLYQFLTNQTLFYQCKTIDLCEVDIISRQDFIEAIKITKNQQIVYRIKNQVLIESRIDLINKICLICNQNNHVEPQCPDIYISKKYLITLNSNNMSYDQQRNENYKRNYHFSNKDQNKPLILKKVYNRNKGLIDQSSERCYIRSRSIIKQIISSNVKKKSQFQQKVYKRQQFEVCRIWKDYYPEFNIIKNKQKINN